MFRTFFLNRRWLHWSVLGTLFIIGVTWFRVQLDVRINEWFGARPAGTRFAIADIPLLYETGQEHEFERVIVCACDPAEQFRRLVARDGLSAEAAGARLAAQWPIAEKVARADYVIWTDGEFADTAEQVKVVFEKLTADS